jgi:hypothetical protein
MPQDPCRLELQAKDLFSALAGLAAAKNRRRTPVSLSFQAGELELAQGVSRARLPASGTWPLVAIAHVNMVKDLLRLRKVLPDVVVLVGRSSTLHFDHYGVGCAWSPHPPDA